MDICVGGVRFLLYLRSDGVLDADNHDAGEFVQDFVLVFPVGLSGLGGEVPVRHADGPQPVARHWLNHLAHHLVTVLRLEDAGLTLGVQNTRASGRGEGGREELIKGNMSSIDSSSLRLGKTITNYNYFQFICSLFLLPQDDLRRPFAVHAETSISVLQHRAHGLAGGVEGVNLVEFFLGDLVSDWLVVSLQLQHHAQQSALRLVANVAREASFFLRRLRRDKSIGCNVSNCIIIRQH